MSIFAEDEVLDAYDTEAKQDEDEKKKVEHLIEYDDGIMHLETVERLASVAAQTEADLPAFPDVSKVKVEGHV